MGEEEGLLCVLGRLCPWGPSVCPSAAQPLLWFLVGAAEHCCVQVGSKGSCYDVLEDFSKVHSSGGDLGRVVDRCLGKTKWMTAHFCG